MADRDTSYTSGPWAVDPDRCVVDQTGMIIAEVFNPSGLLIANCNLIAAAPDLLEALRQLSQAFSITADHFEEVEVDGEMVDPSDLEELARAAIAKATA